MERRGREKSGKSVRKHYWMGRVEKQIIRTAGGQSETSDWKDCWGGGEREGRGRTSGEEGRERGEAKDQIGTTRVERLSREREMEKSGGEDK